MNVETCRSCHTPIMRRRIPFGAAGQLEMLACECDAAKIEAKYRKVGAGKSEEPMKAGKKR